LEANVPGAEGDALAQLARATRALGAALDAPEAADPAYTAAVRAAGLATGALERTGNLSVSVLTGLIRSTAVDLLRALGASDKQAREAVRTAPR